MWPAEQSNQRARGSTWPYTTIWLEDVAGHAEPGRARPGSGSNSSADQRNELNEVSSTAPWPPSEAQSSRFRSKQCQSTEQPYQASSAEVEWRNCSCTGSEQLICVLWSMHLMITLLLSTVSRSYQIGLRRKSHLTYFISADNSVNVDGDTVEWRY